MKVSIITVVYNSKKYLIDCIESVLSQNYTDIEYIIIDGKSTDGSLQIIQSYAHKIHKIVSEPDKGMYDALNKGINLANGEIIGILNADDCLASNDIITKIVKEFENNQIDAVYGDLNYVSATDINIIHRKWRSKQCTYNDLAKGWMPAHPTLYIRKKCFNNLGYYRLDLGSAADYELILRFLYTHRLKSLYIPILMVNMRMGGMSNANWNSRYQALKNDYKALKFNKIKKPLLILMLKKLRKLKQFI